MSEPGDGTGRPAVGRTGPEPEVLGWPDPVAVEQRARAAGAAGWRVVRLDTDEADGAEGFLEACAAAFGLPSWFGANWDALDECLADYRLAGEPGLLVVWSGWQELAESEPEALATAVDVLRTAVAGWRARGAAAQVVITGPGPDLGLPGGLPSADPPVEAG